jgi:hypothetical protein
VVLRGSDAASSKLYAVVGQFATAASFIPWLMLPVTAIWLFVAMKLGRGQRELTDDHPTSQDS